jgi:DNA-binding NtrC family response regulator
VKETILIVDADGDVRRMLGIRLSLIGYAILATSNGEEALHIFKKENVSLVICAARCSETGSMQGKNKVEL